jgi:osmotically-inducible protein OsmY
MISFTISLTGYVERPYQKRVAEEAVCHLKGVQKVLNYIVVSRQMDDLP